MLARIAALLLLAALPLHAPAQPGKKDGPAPAPAQAAPANEPSFIIPYLIGALLLAGVILIVCTPGRKA